MPFTDTPDPIVATLTDLGRTNFARVALGEISFEVKGFSVGRGGYNDTNPVKITPLDPTLTDLEDQYFPVSGYKVLTLVEYPTAKTYVANCRLASTDAIQALGEIGLWAQIVYSAADPLEVGTDFLLAIGHFPMVTKTLRQAIVYRMILQF